MDGDLVKYCGSAVERGATHAKQIHPGTIVTAPWVRLKCQYGCPNYYNRSYCCPPDSPTPDQTRAIVDSYKRCILFHLEAQPTEDREKHIRTYRDTLMALEGEMFKDGYYKALVFLCGPCMLCKECGKLTGDPCRFGSKARPSMEGCGIDVYQTARNNGFFVETLRDKSQTQNQYGLMLVD